MKAQPQGGQVRRADTMTVAEFITHKRWRLKDDRQEAELVRLARDVIAPHYRRLPGCTGLGLLRIRGTRQYITLQYWTDAEAYADIISSGEYESWYQEYQPTLERWYELADFEAEWECENIGDVLAPGSGEGARCDYGSTSR